MAGGIHEADKSIRDLKIQDTSDHRIRAKKVKGTDNTVYVIDSKMKQRALTVLYKLVGEKPVYLGSKEIRQLSDNKINFKTVGQQGRNFSLAVIALKKELSTTDSPDEVLKKYSDDVKKQVLKDLLPRPKTPRDETEHFNLSKNIDRASPQSITESLKFKYTDGINFETGTRDLEKAADRIMNSADPEKALSRENCSPKLARDLFIRYQKLNNSEVSIISINDEGSIDKSLQYLVGSGYSIKTGKQELKQLGEHLLSVEDPAKALASYAPDLKKELLKKMENNPKVQNILKQCEDTSDDGKLKALIANGINVGTGRRSI